MLSSLHFKITTIKNIYHIVKLFQIKKIYKFSLISSLKSIQLLNIFKLVGFIRTYKIIVVHYNLVLVDIYIMQPSSSKFFLSVDFMKNLPKIKCTYKDLFFFKKKYNNLSIIFFAKGNYFLDISRLAAKNSGYIAYIFFW